MKTIDRSVVTKLNAVLDQGLSCGCRPFTDPKGRELLPRDHMCPTCRTAFAYRHELARQSGSHVVRARDANTWDDLPAGEALA